MWIGHRKEILYSGQSALSTQLIKPNYFVIPLPPWSSTTVSLETYHLYSYVNDSISFARYFNCHFQQWASDLIWLVMLLFHFRLWLQFFLKLEWNILISKAKHGNPYYLQYRHSRRLIAMLPSLLAATCSLQDKPRLVAFTCIVMTQRVMPGRWSSFRSHYGLTTCVF